MSDNCYRFSARDDTGFRCDGGGAMLPEVSAEDDGKVLMVSNGSWAAIDPSTQGGSRRPYFNQTITGWDNNQYSVAITNLPVENATYIVTFDGTEYAIACDKITDGTADIYRIGDYDAIGNNFIFVEYPFGISIVNETDTESEDYGKHLTVVVSESEENTHSVKIEQYISESESDSEGCSLIRINLTEYYDPDAERNFVRYTWNDFKAMIDSGKIPYVIYDTANNRQYDPMVSNINDELPVVEFMYFGQLSRSNTGYKMYTVVFRNGAAGTLLLTAHNDDPTKPMYIFTEG